MRWELYDYLNDKGENEISDWVKSLQRKQQIKLETKLDMLAKNGMDLYPHLLTPTKKNHILELKVNGNVALRPMMCKGPTKQTKGENNGDYNKEFTILQGATERDTTYVPSNALELADEKRNEVDKDPNNRRVKHERLSKKSKK